jgi:IS1 family transposase
MANILSLEKQTMAIHALCEGSSIRSVERMTGIHRDTIMRLGVRVGEACQAMMNDKLRDLDIKEVQVDEIWGFIGKKKANIRKGEDTSEIGDVWTFIALDPETKLIPSYVVGKRDTYHTRMFMDDLAGRLKNRVQLSSDEMAAYTEAVERSFGTEVDYGQIVKTYSVTHLTKEAAGRYSPAEVVKAERAAINGNPVKSLISTSLIEKQNHTLRMHCRRLTRLTNAFSKKLDNFKAAVSLNFAYYNFVKSHGSIRMTPAMAAGVTDGFWKVEDLVKL